MSYDIIVQDLPSGATSVEDIPEGFEPAPLGSRQAIIDGILKVVPSADFSDPSWGKIDGDGWSIEVNIGGHDPCRSFSFHVRGDSQALGAVAAILNHLDFRALDTSENGIFSSDRDSIDSFNKWREYRHQIVADYG